MSTNKNAQLRYRILDRCFRNPGRKYFIEDLLNAVNKELEEYNGLGIGIKKRQLYDDIKFMKSDQGWAIPLEMLLIIKSVPPVLTKSVPLKQV